MHDLSPQELLGLFGHFAALSMLAVGGAITTAPEMHRYLVEEHGWLSDGQFTDAIALAQAAPGPNLLFVAVMGWNAAGAWGVAATMLGILLPSSVLAFWVARLQGANREHLFARAFTTGMAPLTIGLLLATAWLLAEPALRALWRHGWPLAWAAPSAELARAVGSLGLLAFAVWAMLRKKLSPMALVGVGAALGALGLV